MSNYFCFVHVRPDAVPELRVLDCEGEDHLAAGVSAALREWPSACQVEVMDGERRVLIASGLELDRFKSI